MADPELEWGLVFHADGSIDILRSPCFDVGFEDNATIEEYLERVVPILASIFDRQFHGYTWTIIGRHPPPPSPVNTFPATKSFVAFIVVVLFILVWFFLLR
ncbi:hypothetical protein MA16_Dca020185 [Dendrobium catenatum]|uniref:Uncharacterized protein n=1 Tax=Dendrobium catenatum TaxID=906689 RepID=A0A2I0WH42_9ASPA|nr:hypothetical protein MA16_Dca020185 [Dendrobium catenatum]